MELNYASKLKQETNLELRILQNLLPQLDEKEQLAIHFRFWECMTIGQIASVLGISWDAADKLIEDILTKLRVGFLKHALAYENLVA